MGVKQISLVVTALVLSTSVNAAVVFSDDFADGSSLDKYQIFGEQFTNYNPPPLHDVYVQAGQLHIDTTYYTPNPGQSPTLSGRAVLSTDVRDSFGQGYNPILSQNAGLLSWSVNIANQNGDLNNKFHFVLASTTANPYDIGSHNYALRGGGMVGDRMVLERKDFGLGGGGAVLIDVADGLGTLPEMGSFRITYDPASDLWSLYADIGASFTNPSTVSNLLGTAIDDRYTDEAMNYFAFGGGTTGKDIFDNITVNAVVPIPAATWLFGSGLIGLIGLARRKAS